MSEKKSVVITGIGLISSLGEGVDAHWDALQNSINPNLDQETFPPYTVHVLGEVDWGNQIPKRSDQRQMETWQRLGTYAAGLALDDAGLKGNDELLSKMDMIVAAGGGERDINVDVQILEKARNDVDRGVMLNQMLSTELRPTLFLAQLTNLLAGNISIVHKVIGSSRSFMGEEGAGLSAVNVAVARIMGGQSTHALVGGSYNAQHYDMLLGHELSGLLHSDQWAPVWERKNANGGGLVTGSGGVFLVLEEAEHARQRGAAIYAEIQSVFTDQVDRHRINVGESIKNLLVKAQAQPEEFVLSSASGVDDITQKEQSILEELNTQYRAVCSRFGHLREAQFPFALALGALAVKNSHSFSGFSASETGDKRDLSTLLVTAVGIKRGEGIARLVSV